MKLKNEASQKAAIADMARQTCFKSNMIECVISESTKNNAEWNSKPEMCERRSIKWKDRDFSTFHWYWRGGSMPEKGAAD